MYEFRSEECFMKKYFSRLCGNKRAVSMIAPKIEKDIHSHAYIIEGPKELFEILL